MNRDSNGFISTDSELLGFEVPVLYSGASGINVDNENYVISFTGTAYGSGGKTYQGVSPIVVNNQEDKISANTAPFGVQSPLYFVQDDDSGVVIGFSGDVDPVTLSSKLDISAFEAWQTGQYTNDISTITNNVSAISSEIPDVSQFVTSSDLSTLSSEITSLIPSTAGLASETYVQQQVSSKLDESVYASQSGNFLTAIPAEYATQDWVTGQNYLTSIPPEYSTSSDLVTLSGDIVSQIPDVSNYATLTDLESTSADITAMIPSTAGLASETYVQQNTSGKADKSEIPDVSNFITNASAEETYQTIDGMTAYQAAGNYLSSNALEGYATESFVENVSADITALIPDTSDFATTADLSNYYPKTDTSSKDELDYAFSHITGGGSTYTSPLNTILVDNENSTLEGTDSAYVFVLKEDLISAVNGINTNGTRISCNKLSWDFTGKYVFPFGNSYLVFTAYDENNHSLTSMEVSAANDIHLVSSYYNPSAINFYMYLNMPTGTLSGISSYYTPETVQLARKNDLDLLSSTLSTDYATNSYVDGSVSGKLDSTAFSTVSGNFLTAVDLTPYQLTADMTAYAPTSSVSAAEWNDCYENVSTNSGVWCGSALPISAGPGIKMEVVNNTLVVSNNNETVLWETTAYNGASAITLSEPYTNFEKLGIAVARGQGNQTTPYGYSGPWMYFDCDGIITGTYKAYGSLTPALMERQYWKYSVYSAVNTTSFRWAEGGEKNILTTGAGATAASWTAAPTIRKVVGIGRRS